MPYCQLTGFGAVCSMVDGLAVNPNLKGNVSNTYEDRQHDRDWLLGSAFSLLGMLQEEGDDFLKRMVQGWLTGYRNHRLGNRANVWYLSGTQDRKETK